MRLTRTQVIQRGFIFAFCILLAILSILPFWVMIVNATRSSAQIQGSAFSLIPSSSFAYNYSRMMRAGAFNPFIGYLNSAIVSVGATVLGMYFSSLTAFALVVYQWRFRKAFFAFIVAIMMIPAQVTTIGFFQFMLQIKFNNNLLPLILPSIASPTIVFFMRQYLLGSLSLDIVNSARIDNASEFRIFNQIILPLMKPAIATQAIFVFVSTWNNFLIPRVLLSDMKLFTMPIMVSLLRNDIYRVEYGTIFLGLTMSVLPLFVVYFTLSKYIIAGVALGGVKE
ncbi:MAG: carbohydrate ABC transporter permease [Clostridiales bacterium]|jgi:multiple sugar transport system permease protein|nr:carbohydrate ABC transporter permease [Clostridiales bacterium]